MQETIAFALAMTILAVAGSVGGDPAAPTKVSDTQVTLPLNAITEF